MIFDGAIMKTIYLKANFEESCATMKPVHAVNNGPRQGGAHLTIDLTQEFREIGIPFSRLHDTEYPYGCNQFVDIHCIFPDFSADAEKESSYNFTATDAYIQGIINAGTQVFYRLGESIDHFETKLYVHPPKDYLKWAKICEHIILHYNAGWAKGFFYNIRYWEIWNEPDNPAMWTGTKKEFFDLYRVAANYLKEKFPDLQIGGYSASGFYMTNRDHVNDWFKTLVPYSEEFFTYITAPETKAPMDFFSWHCYAESPEEIAVHAKYARNLLDRYGLVSCKSFLTEYNTFYSLGMQPNKKRGYPAELAAGLIMAQKSMLDMMMYYDMRINFMNGLVSVTDSQCNDLKRYPAFYAMEMFGKMYRLEKQYPSEDAQGVYTLAAGNEKDGYAVMIVSTKFSGVLHLNIENVQKAFSVYERKKNGKYSYICKIGQDKAEVPIKAGGLYIACEDKMPMQEQISETL